MFEVNRTSSVSKSVLRYELDKDVPTLSLFLRPILSVFFSKTEETDDVCHMVCGITVK